MTSTAEPAASVHVLTNRTVWRTRLRVRIPIEATARVPINRPDTYQRLPRRAPNPLAISRRSSSEVDFHELPDIRAEPPWPIRSGVTTTLKPLVIWGADSAW